MFDDRRTTAPKRAETTRAKPSPQSGLLRVQELAGNAATAQLVRDAQGQETAGRGGEPEAGAGGGPTPARRTLRRGDTGTDVKLLQMKLRQVREREHDRDAANQARIDGIFGPLTHADVVDFQTDTGLDPDGIVGLRTWHAIDSLVPQSPVEENEVANNERFAHAITLEVPGSYDRAIAIYQDIALNASSPEMIGPAMTRTGICHQARGRFGAAVQAYETALAGRFNQEALRRQILDRLTESRQNRFSTEQTPDPEPALPGIKPGSGADTHAGGGIKARIPAKSGEAGPHIDLFKGKLANMMVGWAPNLAPGNGFDGTTVEKARSFQKAVGIEQTGEADATTWHALDSFMKADVPFTVIAPMFARAIAANDPSITEPRPALAVLEKVRDEARELGLHEIVKNTEALIGKTHHRLSEFDQAVAHYELYLARLIPSPPHYEFFLEHLRKARAHEPV